MKLRYYMRGLGIGMVVTALIMGVSTGDARPLTDAEIKAKAATLGMVESDSLKLSQVGTTAEPTEEPAAEPTVQPSGETDVQYTEEATAEPTAEPTAEAMAEPTAEPTAKPTVEPTAEPTTKPTAEPIAEPTATPVVTTAPGEVETITLTVVSGSGSDTVCRQLEKAGVIENAKDFDRYLIDNGYSKRISVGTFEIMVDATWEEIAKIITKSR